MTGSAASVSVALCTHNGAAFLEQQLRSIAGQSVPPFEIVVSDDASTDDTTTIVERFAASVEGRIDVVLLRNATALGVTANFEQALRRCTGELIALCDQDDVWHPDRLERMTAAFESPSASPSLALVSADARLVDAAGMPLGHSLFEALELGADELAALNDGHALDALLRRNLVTGATTVIRRSLLDLTLPFPAPWVHDEWLAVVAAALRDVAALPVSLTDYRQHGSNQIGVQLRGFRAKFARLTEPRGDRNDYLLERAVVLRNHLVGQPGLSTAVRTKLDGKVAHQRARAALSGHRIRRVIPVLREAGTGRYSLYSRGRLDIIRDLIQPA